MDDNTQMISKPSGKKVEESYFLSHNLSGRFWIAVILALGLVLNTTLVLIGAAKLDTNLSVAIYTAYCSGALGLVGIYMGQNSKPKAQEGEPTK